MAGYVSMDKVRIAALEHDVIDLKKKIEVLEAQIYILDLKLKFSRIPELGDEE